MRWGFSHRGRGLSVNYHRTGANISKDESGRTWDELPQLQRHLLGKIFARLTDSEKEFALRNQLLPVAWLPDRTLYAAVEGNGFDRAEDLNVKPVARIKPKDFLDGIKRFLGPEILHRATSHLKTRAPMFSAHRRIIASQGFFLSAIIFIFFATLIILPNEIGFAVISLILNSFFLGVVSLRLMCVFNANQKKKSVFVKIPDEALPIYSVLVPLFRETDVLHQLIAALTQLDYPSHLLDIKLILEETDISMHRAVAILGLPKHISVVVVPAGKPQTKPRALNYALQFARGELITIYDVEDLPEPDQLRKAAAAFAMGPAHLACLQAELTFYNAEENWMTRQFTLEYSILFGIILPGLAHEKLPLPLGGTSNHFRTHILRNVGAWDPYNVTEDADLGLRLARHHYTTHVLDSRTFEEANTEFGNWVSQRARWFKGFLQTWLVHMRQPLVLKKEIGWGGIWATQVNTFGVVF